MTGYLSAEYVMAAFPKGLRCCTRERRGVARYKRGLQRSRQLSGERQCEALRMIKFSDDVATADAAISIRRATINEIPEIASLIDAAFAQFRAHLPTAISERYLESPRDVKARWHDSEVLVAESERRIVGAVTFYADASLEGLGLPQDWAGFRTLGVHPAARGRGVGRLLVEDCLIRSRESGSRSVGIHTADFMTVTCALYEQIGFRRSRLHDLRASQILGFDPTLGDVEVIAYSLELIACDRRDGRQNEAA